MIEGGSQLAGDENALAEIAVRHITQVERFERTPNPRLCRTIAARHEATLPWVHRRARLAPPRPPAEVGGSAEQLVLVSS